MIRASGHMQGYTIVETLIFLAVTGMLFVSVISLMGGQQNKAQFTQSIRDIDSKVQDVINDVATGYYNNSDKFSCVGLITSGTDIGQPKITGGPNNQGTNEDCIFAGRVMQFAENGTAGAGYNIFDMVGRRQAPSGQEVSSLYEAQVIPLERGLLRNNIPASVSSTDKGTLQNGLNVTRMYYTDSVGTRVTIGAVGFFTTFATYSSVGINSGSGSTNMVPIASATSDLNKTKKEMVDAIVNYLNPVSPPTPGGGNPPAMNPGGGVTICFKSGGTDQYGVLTIGSNSRQLTTKVEIMSSAAALVPVTGACI